MQKLLKLHSVGIGPDHPCFIIAEAGVNHNGDLDLALRLIDAAADAKVDAVKFQSFRSEQLVSTEAPKAEYQLQATSAGESQLDMLRHLELKEDAHRQLWAHCTERGVLFLSTPFDELSADFLDELGIPIFKIGSGEITNWPFLEHVARKGKPVVLSTGMSDLEDVRGAVGAIRGAGNDQLVLLHCVSSYPADPAHTNLSAMRTMADAFRVPVGFSDHTLGIEVALAAAALGACVIEKHFTLDKTLPGPDHGASLEPDELRKMVSGIRLVEQALGDGVKEPAPGEVETGAVVRRSLVAAVDIPKGVVLEPSMLKALRPASGISPSRVGEVLGRRARRTIEEGEFLDWGDLE